MRKSQFSVDAACVHALLFLGHDAAVADLLRCHTFVIYGVVA